MYLTFFIAVVSVVFNRLLIEDDGLLNFYGKWIDNLPKWLNYPLGRCTYCFGGQIALWLFLFRFALKEEFSLYYLMIISYVCITIFLIHILAFIWDLIENLWKKM